MIHLSADAYFTPRACNLSRGAFYSLWGRSRFANTGRLHFGVYCGRAQTRKPEYATNKWLTNDNQAAPTNYDVRAHWVAFLSSGHHEIVKHGDGIFPFFSNNSTICFFFLLTRNKLMYLGIDCWTSHLLIDCDRTQCALIASSQCRFITITNCRTNGIWFSSRAFNAMMNTQQSQSTSPGNGAIEESQIANNWYKLQ